MLRGRWLSSAFLIGTLSAAAWGQPAKAPAAPGAPDGAVAAAKPDKAGSGGIEVRAAFAFIDNRNVIRVAGRAPLPDRAIVQIVLTYETDAPGHPPFMTRRARVQKGTFQLDVDDRQEEFFPGVYRVEVGLDEDGVEEVGGLTPELRKLTGETRVRVGSPFTACQYAASTAGKILPEARALLAGYPGLIKLFQRALKKDLTAAEWQQWASGNPLSLPMNRLSGLLYSRGMKQILPVSTARVQAAVHEYYNMMEYIPFILRGKYNSQDGESEIGSGITALGERLAKEAKEGGEVRPATADVNVVLLYEGRSLHAAACDRIREDMEAAFLATQGKDAAAWGKESPRLGGTIEDLRAIYGKFAGLEWSLDEAKVAGETAAMEGLFAALKSLLDEFGRVRTGQVSLADSGVPVLRADVDQRLALLRQPTVAAAAPAVPAPPAEAGKASKDAPKPAASPDKPKSAPKSGAAAAKPK